MKINKLQINDFGKFSNKEIKFADNLNVIMGDNESGKSTIQKFIVSMFYGISGDKRKSNFTDYDKYFPWDKESFTGKLKYTLDNGESYEIYRDFTKRNPVIYNENAEDITNQFSKSKSKGSSAFEEQTGIDEQTMLSSMVSEQGNVIIDQTSENFVIQKLANMTETGDERISYESAQKYLLKKRNDDVGTGKTRNKPINILQIEKKSLAEEMNTLEGYNSEQYEIESSIRELDKRQTENEKLLSLSTKYRRIVENEASEYNKIELYNETLSKNRGKIEELQKQKDNEKKSLQEKSVELENEIRKLNIKNEKINDKNQKIKQSMSKTKKVAIFISAIFMMLAMVMIITIKSIPIGTLLAVIAIGCMIGGLIYNKSKKRQIEKNNGELTNNESEGTSTELENIKKNLQKLDMEINMLASQNEEIRKKTGDLQDKIKNTEEQKINELKQKFSDITKEECEMIFDKNNIYRTTEKLQKNKNDISVEIEKMEYRKKVIMPQLEKYMEIEERLSELDNREEEMMREVEALTIASQALEEAYGEMKKNVIPRFTEKLSNTIAYVSNGKYKKVVTNDKEGLLVEKENGEYITAKALSIGTIDQLYLSLRFAIIQENSTQSMPIILDEAFAYYDDKRLKNILNYIATEFKNHQIILFTCTTREIDTLNEMNENYNLIQL